MRVNVLLPGQLAALAGGDEVVVVTGETVGQALEDLVTRFPDLRDRLFGDDGLKRFVNLYLGDDDIRLLDGLSTAVEDDAELSVVPAIAGGAGAVLRGVR